MIISLKCANSECIKSIAAANRNIQYFGFLFFADSVGQIRYQALQGVRVAGSVVRGSLARRVNLPWVMVLPLGRVVIGMIKIIRRPEGHCDTFPSTD